MLMAAGRMRWGVLNSRWAWESTVFTLTRAHSNLSLIARILEHHRPTSRSLASLLSLPGRTPTLSPRPPPRTRRLAGPTGAPYLFEIDPTALGNADSSYVASLLQGSRRGLKVRTCRQDVRCVLLSSTLLPLLLSSPIAPHHLPSLSAPAFSQTKFTHHSTSRVLKATLRCMGHPAAPCLLPVVRHSHCVYCALAERIQSAKNNAATTVRRYHANK